MLTRSGYVVSHDPDIKKTLTVRPESSGDYARPPAFKVFRERGKYLCVPRYFGIDTFGQPKSDTRPEPSAAHIPFVGTLRAPIQTDAHTLGIQAMNTIGGGVLSLYCGGGKTTVALAIASHFKLRTMIVVHKEFLADQWAERIREFCPGATIGRVQGDKLDTNHDFVIALIQTMSQREFPKETFDSIGMLIVDEAHHICARAFSQFLFKISPRYTLGLSATPERKDGLTRLLYWFLGPQFYAIERDSENVLVKTLAYNGPFPQVSMTQYGKMSLPTMLTDLTMVEQRNELILGAIRDLLTTDRNILVLTDRREHAMYLLEQFGETGGLYIGGADLEHGASKRLIFATFSLAQEGLDIPKLDTVILATPKSDIKQAVGRIMRGKTASHPLIYDVVDHWSVFFSMARKRFSTYRQLNFEIETPIHEAASSFPKGVCLL